MKFVNNWKTTISGLASLLFGLASVLSGDLTSGIPAITSGVGLIFATDVAA